MERLQGCGPSGTAVPGQYHTRFGAGACLGVQLDPRNILDALHMSLLYTPDVLHAYLVQEWDTHEVTPIWPSQLLQKPVNHLDSGLLAACPPATVLAKVIPADIGIHQAI